MTDTMGALDRKLLRDMLLAVQVGEKILFEDFVKVFGPDFHKDPIHVNFASILHRLRKQGYHFLTIQKVGLLRLSEPARRNRVVFHHYDREIWAMAEAAPKAKLPV